MAKVIRLFSLVRFQSIFSAIDALTLLKRAG
jgi:hypothetical protein